jgi:hypothetical protein
MIFLFTGIHFYRSKDEHFLKKTEKRKERLLENHLDSGFAEPLTAYTYF